HHRRRQGIPVGESPHLAPRRRRRWEGRQGGVGRGRAGTWHSGPCGMVAERAETGRDGDDRHESREGRHEGRDHRARHQGRRHHPVESTQPAVRRTRMQKIIGSIAGAAILLGASPFVSARAAEPADQGSSPSAATPDFSGVYYPFQQGRGGGQRAAAPPAGAQRGGPPPRPTQSAPLSDGSQGRSPDAPSLTPEYLAKWEMMRKSRIAGSYEFDNNAKCLPPGMPAMMGMAYGMEVMQTK